MGYEGLESGLSSCSVECVRQKHHLRELAVEHQRLDLPSVIGCVLENRAVQVKRNFGPSLVGETTQVIVVPRLESSFTTV
jgi:hypothetical protein